MTPPPLLSIPGSEPPAGGETAWVTGAGGVRLRAALFPATGAPRGSVILSGGRTEAIEKYYEVIEELRGRGFAVLTHDWRGQGLSARLTADPLAGHAVGFAPFVADHRAVLDAFEGRLPKPWLAVSHSMGGCLTVLALAHGEDRLAGVVTTAPMFGVLLNGRPAWQGVLLSTWQRLAGRGALVIGEAQGDPGTVPFEGNVLTHDPVRYARNQAMAQAHPQLRLGGPTWGWLNFALAASAFLKKDARVTRVRTPVVVLSAGDEAIVDNLDQRFVTGRLPNGRFVEVPGARHEILQETDTLRAPFWAAFDEMAAGLTRPSA